MGTRHTCRTLDGRPSARPRIPPTHTTPPHPASHAPHTSRKTPNHLSLNPSLSDSDELGIQIYFFLTCSDRAPKTRRQQPARSTFGDRSGPFGDRSGQYGDRAGPFENRSGQFEGRSGPLGKRSGTNSGDGERRRRDHDGRRWQRWLNCF